MTEPKSPAVEAYENEQAAQRDRHPETELDRGLKDTFPASDPVSTTITAIPAGTVAPTESVRREQVGTRVDEALRSARSRDHGAGSADPAEELRALQAEVAGLRETLAEIGASSLRVARSHADDALETTRDRIREKPLAAVGIAALLGFVWGITR